MEYTANEIKQIHTNGYKQALKHTMDMLNKYPVEVVKEMITNLTGNDTIEQAEKIMEEIEG